MIFLKKVFIALLSALIFSLALAFWEYTPAHEQHPNVGYFSFSGLVILYFIYSLPIYIVGGIFVVALLLGFMYIIDGHLSGLLFLNIFILGVFASLIFYHVSFVLDKVLESRM